MHDIEQGIGNSGASTQANVVLVGHENTRRPTGLENLDSGATGITSAARRDSSWVVLGRPGSSWTVQEIAWNADAQNLTRLQVKRQSPASRARLPEE
ncbi:uncharacterized protein PADG_12256 [Paracoccidioides brasiliensis Pb18]|uniref:Uncharacterized protein n=1 Tax=Paracoccidioides brasiliensis (strain Pb18) TaxID=502780 RepID=A0A0A0HR66_PARBD|nr:uncharacterized protein PADG_12256 [Paracoccidioides brasiliensis Pb18]KGM91684.1 hypothetical protein PADG_12256 [Paracoccidioides brasiliensis Pb18]